MKKLLATVLLLLMSSSAYAWNEKGHYVVCRLAWLQMTDQQRAKVTEILKKHPHEEKHQPPAGQENAVWAMNRCLDKIKDGTDEEKAVYLTWLCHLVGDIHQPLHCVVPFSDKYPDGDRGGNAIRIRISSNPTNLHSLWDGLLGRGTTAGNIGKDVAENREHPPCCRLRN